MFNRSSTSVPQTDDDRFSKITPEVDQRLNEFIKTNSRLTSHYTELVNSHPERAVRTLMLNRMFRHEAEIRIAKNLAPGAMEWLEKQTPEVQQRVHDRVERFSPMNREKALVDIIGEERNKLDFSRRESQSQGHAITQ